MHSKNQSTTLMTVFTTSSRDAINMVFNYTSFVTTPMRQALIDFANQVLPNPSHMLTINFHDYYQPDRAFYLVRTWYQFLMRRMFGRKWLVTNNCNNFEFLLYPEYSVAGHIHYHGPMLLAENHSDYFERIASNRWQAIIPTGSLHFQPVKSSKHDRIALYRYITKSSTEGSVIHSSMLRD